MDLNHSTTPDPDEPCARCGCGWYGAGGKHYEGCPERERQKAEIGQMIAEINERKRKMSESQHTQSPWTVESATDGRRRGYIRSSDGKAVARVTEAGREYSEIGANARLIAAAPDLLAALQQAEMALTGFIRPTGVIADAITTARAAIAKAKGE